MCRDDGSQRIGKGDDQIGVHDVLAAPDDRSAVENDPGGGLLSGDGAASGQPSASHAERSAAGVRLATVAISANRMDAQTSNTQKQKP